MESSHASLKTPKVTQSHRSSRAAAKKVAALSFSRNTCKERECRPRSLKPQPRPQPRPCPTTSPAPIPSPHISAASSSPASWEQANPPLAASSPPVSTGSSSTSTLTSKPAPEPPFLSSSSATAKPTSAAYNPPHWPQLWAATTPSSP